MPGVHSHLHRLREAMVVNNYHDAGLVGRLSLLSVEVTYCSIDDRGRLAPRCFAVL